MFNLSRNKVVVTGMGMITSLGSNVKKTWENVVNGKSGVDYITLFDTQNSATKFAAEVKDDFEIKAKELLKRKERIKMTRLTRMAMVAVNEALEDSGIDFDQYDRSRIAVIMGVVTSAYNDIEREKSEDNIIVKSMPNSLSAWISINNNLYGPNYNVSTACASSAYAIAFGQQMISSGMADVVIVGGADSHINEECIKGFNQIYALSARNDSPQTASRPFSLGRNGFVMGEGVGVLILESEESAKKHNSKIYAEIPGYSLTSEAFDITSPQSDGIGMAKTMREAIENAGICIDDIDYINAHGTSTYLNDKYETMAIKECFGEKAYDIAVSSTKSMIGHTIGAAGAIEGIITILSINNGIITPTINYEVPDPELDLEYVPNEAIKRDVNVAISNSFGFGGHNASIVFKKYKC